MLKPNSVLISRRQKTPVQIDGSIAAPCCVIGTQEEFWAQEPGRIYDERPSAYLLEKWIQLNVLTWAAKAKN
jgi:hypothetical protein